VVGFVGETRDRLTSAAAYACGLCTECWI